MTGDSFLWLASLMLVPGLLLLLMLMQWLENHFVRRMVADDIGLLLVVLGSRDDIEAGIATAAAPLFRFTRRDAP